MSEEVEGILGKLRPEPAREPLPLRRHYELPSKGRYSGPAPRVIANKRSGDGGLRRPLRDL